MRRLIYGVISLALISLFAFPVDISAQKRRRSYSSSSLYLEPQFFILRDENIPGHVFKGPNFSLGYNQLKQSIYGFSRYEAAFSAGAVLGGETMGFNLHLKPLDLAGGLPLVDDDEISVYMGAYAAMNYYLQIFTELENANVFWFTFIDAGPRVILEKKLKKQKFRFQLANSCIGIASRPEGLEDTYDQDQHTVDIISKMHSNLQPGSFNRLNHTDFELEWRDFNKMGSSIAYRLEYFGFYSGARLDYLVNSISIRFLVGGEVK